MVFLSLCIMSVYHFLRCRKFLKQVKDYFERMAKRKSIDSGGFFDPSSPENRALASLNRVSKLLRYISILNIMLIFSILPMALSGRVFYGYFAPHTFAIISAYLFWVRLAGGVLQLRMSRSGNPRDRSKSSADAEESQDDFEEEPPQDLRAGPKVAYRDDDDIDFSEVTTDSVYYDEDITETSGYIPPPRDLRAGPKIAFQNKRAKPSRHQKRAATSHRPEI